MKLEDVRIAEFGAKREIEEFASRSRNVGEKIVVLPVWHSVQCSRPSRTINSVCSAIYRNAAATMTSMPALPAYMEFNDEAAPMKLLGMDVVAAPGDVAAGVLLPMRVGVVVILEVVPTAVGPAKVVVLPAEYVLVTDATTSEMVMVLVRVAVDVRVVVEESAASARRGRSSIEVIVERCILYVCINVSLT